MTRGGQNKGVRNDHEQRQPEAMMVASGSSTKSGENSATNATSQPLETSQLMGTILVTMDMMLVAMETMFQRIEDNQSNQQQQFGEHLMERFDKRQHYFDNMMQKGFRDLGKAISELAPFKFNQVQPRS